MNTLQDKFLGHMKKYKKNIKINGIDNTAFFKEIDEKDSTDKKYMFVSLGSCKQGDLIEYNNYKWLVVSQSIAYNDVYEKVVIQKCQYNIKFMKNGILGVIPAIFETKTMDIDTNQYISLPVNKINLTVQSNEFNQQIGLNNRFINTGRAWKVIGLDRTKDNLITVNSELDSINPNVDDAVNEIANKSIYSFAITNLDTSILEGEELQVSVEYKDGDTLLNDYVTFEYSVDDEDIATISETGLLTGVSVGEVVVTVTIKENPYFTATKSFTIESAAIPSYEISPLTTEILQNQTVAYSVYKKLNGVIQPETFTFTRSGASTSKYTFTIQDGNHFSVKSLGYDATKLTVLCTCTDGGTASIQIQLKNLW